VKWSVVIMGGSLVGKNTLVKAAVDCFDGRVDTTVKNKHVINVEFSSELYEISLESFYDTGLTSNEQKTVLQADGFIIMYDVTNKFSLERAKMYYKKILQMRDPTHVDAQSLTLHSGPPTTSSSTTDTHSNGGTPRQNAPSSPMFGNGSPTTVGSAPISKVPFVLIANKCDVEEAERQVTVSDGLRLADQFNCPYMEVSAMKKIKTVEEMFREVVKTIDRSKKQLLKLQQRAESRERNSSLKLKGLNFISQSESENTDANYVEMMKQRKRQQSIRNTIGGNAPTTSGTGVPSPPSVDTTAGNPESARQ
jgi:GTPase SAR1 family protein